MSPALNVVLSIMGWLADKFLPAILAYGLGKKSARADVVEAQNAERQEANNAMHDHLDMSDDEFIDSLRPGPD